MRWLSICPAVEIPRRRYAQIITITKPPQIRQDGGRPAHLNIVLTRNATGAGPPLPKSGARFCDVGTPDGRSEAYTNAPDVALHRAEFMQRACRRRKSDLVPLTRQSLDGTQGEKLLVEFLDNVCIYSASPVGYE